MARKIAAVMQHRAGQGAGGRAPTKHGLTQARLARVGQGAVGRAATERGLTQARMAREPARAARLRGARGRDVDLQALRRAPLGAQAARAGQAHAAARDLHHLVADHVAAEQRLRAAAARAAS